MAEYVLAAALRAPPLPILRIAPCAIRLPFHGGSHPCPIKQLHVRFALVAAVASLCLAFAPAALAGKGGRPRSRPAAAGGTISLVLSNSTDGLAH